MQEIAKKKSKRGEIIEEAVEASEGAEMLATEMIMVIGIEIEALMIDKEEARIVGLMISQEAGMMPKPQQVIGMIIIAIVKLLQLIKRRMLGARSPVKQRINKSNSPMGGLMSRSLKRYKKIKMHLT